MHKAITDDHWVFEYYRKQIAAQYRKERHFVCDRIVDDPLDNTHGSGHSFGKHLLLEENLWMRVQDNFGCGRAARTNVFKRLRPF